MQGLGCKKFAGAVAAVAMATSSTGAIAATTPVAHGSISPLVALSALGSDASRAALCGASVAAAASAAMSQAGPAQGCVLPVADAVPVAVSEPLPPPPVIVPPVAVASGFGISPLLLGLAGVAGAILLATLLTDDDDDEDASPN
jgi:hypothetical protein